MGRERISDEMACSWLRFCARLLSHLGDDSEESILRLEHDRALVGSHVHVECIGCGVHVEYDEREALRLCGDRPEGLVE